MKRLTLLALLVAIPAAAQPAPSSVTISPDLVIRLNNFLLTGGTHSEGSGLSNELLADYRAAQMAAQMAAAKSSEEKPKAAEPEKAEPPKPAEKPAPHKP